MKPLMPEESKSRMVSRLRAKSGLLAVAGLSLVLAACGDRHLSTMDPESPIADTLDSLLVWLLVASAVVFVLVQGAVIYMARRFSVKAPEDESMVYPDEDFPDQVHGNTRLEIGWTILPTVIMAVVAFFTLGVLFELDDVDADPNAEISSVTVVGQQWWWEFQYDLDGDGEPEFVTANDLVLPQNEEIRLHVTSRDVIHSFWVPALNGKRDAVPGRTSPWTIETRTVGRFPGECTEFCGLSHAYMEKFAVGVPVAEWQEWAAIQMADAEVPTDPEALAGWTVFENNCASCHTVNGLTTFNVDMDGNVLTDIEGLVEGEDYVVETAGPEHYDGANRLIGKQTQVSGAAPNMTHFAGRSSFAGGIFDLYEDWDQHDYTDLAANGDLNRGALEAWIVNAPEQKANAWDSPGGQRGMTPFEALSAEDVDNLVAFLMSLD